MKHLNLRGACLFMCLLFSGTILAQTTITGKVVNSDKQYPLAGAIIPIKGENAHALTNGDAEYWIWPVNKVLIPGC